MVQRTCRKGHESQEQLSDINLIKCIARTDEVRDGRPSLRIETFGIHECGRDIRIFLLSRTVCAGRIHDAGILDEQPTVRLQQCHDTLEKTGGVWHLDGFNQ